MFDDKRWKIAAKVLTWAEKNFDIIKNSQFFGENPEEGGVYGYYAFDGKDKAIMSIRNSSAQVRSYELNNEQHCFDDANYTISEYYPTKGELSTVKKGEKYHIDLPPYSSKILNISLIK